MSWRCFRDILYERTKNSQWRKPAEAAQIIATATTVCNNLFSVISQHIQVTQYKDGVLTLQTNHPANAQAIRQQQQKFLAEVQSRHPGVVSLRIRVQPLTGQ